MRRPRSGGAPSQGTPSRRCTTVASWPASGARRSSSSLSRRPVGAAKPADGPVLEAVVAGCRSALTAGVAAAGTADSRDMRTFPRIGPAEPTRGVSPERANIRARSGDAAAPSRRPGSLPRRPPSTRLTAQHGATPARPRSLDRDVLDGFWISRAARQRPRAAASAPGRAGSRSSAHDDQRASSVASVHRERTSRPLAACAGRKVTRPRPHGTTRAVRASPDRRRLRSARTRRKDRRDMRRSGASASSRGCVGRSPSRRSAQQ